MPTEEVAAGNDLLFSKFAVKIAQHRAFSSSWMVGVGEPETSSAQSENDIKGDSINLTEFKTNLELAGLGSNVQNLSEKERAQLDPELRNEDASMAFLREHLLGKGAKKQKSTTSTNPPGLSLYGMEPTFKPNQKDILQAATTSNHEDEVHTRKPVTAPVEDDGEDVVGRSGIGGQKPGKKSKKPKSGSGKEISVEQRQSREGDQHDTQNALKSTTTEDEVEAKRAVTTAPQDALNFRPKSKKKATSYLDELLAQKKKKKNG